LEKDGHFYPLHVAAEAGHKNLIILLVKAGADPLSTDYRWEYFD
jgi:ankyrin repeat protein